MIKELQTFEFYQSGSVAFVHRYEFTGFLFAESERARSDDMDKTTACPKKVRFTTAKKDTEPTDIARL